VAFLLGEITDIVMKDLSQQQSQKSNTSRGKSTNTVVVASKLNARPASGLGASKTFLKSSAHLANFLHKKDPSVNQRSDSEQGVVVQEFDNISDIYEHAGINKGIT